MEEVQIRGGAILNVVRRGKNEEGIFVTLSDPQSSTRGEGFAAWKREHRRQRLSPAE